MYTCPVEQAHRFLLDRLPLGRARNSSNNGTQSNSSTTPAAVAEPQAPSTTTNDPAAEALLALLDYSMAHPQQQQLGGPGGHPVLRLLLSRLQDGSTPGRRGDDRFKLGLVVEGELQGTAGLRGLLLGFFNLCTGQSPSVWATSALVAKEGT